MVPKLEARLDAWKDREQPPKKNIAEVKNRESRAVYLVDKPGALQSVIITGLLAPPTNNPDEIAIETMNNILGGTFTSRLNMNLREDKHWAYGAFSMMFDARGQRMYLTYAPVQTDKTKESMAEVDKELREILHQRPAEAAELDKSKRNQTLRLPGRFETKGALRGAISEIVNFRLSEDYYETYAGKVRALELSDISKAAERLVKPDRLVWIVVGDLAKVEAGIRELGFEEIPPHGPRRQRIGLSSWWLSAHH